MCRAEDGIPVLGFMLRINDIPIYHPHRASLMSIVEDYADSVPEWEYLESLSRSDHPLNESMEAVVKLTDIHNRLLRIVASTDSLSNEAFISDYTFEMRHMHRMVGLPWNGADLSLEGVGSSIANVAKAIYEAVKRFFSSLIETMKNIDLATSVVRMQLKHLQKTVNTSRGKSVSESTITLGRNYRFLRVGQLFADDSIKLEQELTSLANVVKVFSTQYINSVMTHAEQLPATIEGKTDAALETELIGLVQKIDFSGVASKLSMTPAPQERFNRSGLLTTGPLLGGKSVYFFRQDLQERGVAGLRFHMFLYDNSSREDYRVDASRDFNTLNPAQVAKIPAKIIEILDLISKQNNVMMQSRISRIKGVLERYSKKVEGSAMSAKDVENIRDTITTLIYWMRSPVADLYGTAMSVCRVSVSYCSKSVSTYR